MQLLLKSAKLTAVAGLRMARSLQLAGSSRVEFVLPAGAEFARKALDSPENRSWIEQEILKLTGKTVAVGVRLAPPDATPEVPPSYPEPEATAPDKKNAGTPGKPPASSPPQRSTAPQNTSNRRDARREPEEAPQSNLIGEVDPKRDAYVCHVIDTFNATVVRITHAPAARGTTSEPS
ncbi:MAG: hypothetical protein ACKPHU_16505 [Planctomycetaceae bacterium]